jgi:hypothetical protein
MNRLKIISMAGLAALDLVAVLFAWRSFSGADATDRLPVRSASTIVPAALSDASAATEGNDPETLARPLFAKSRRPWQGGPPLANEASAAPPPAGLKLRAIVGFNRSAHAFVISSAAAEGKWLSVGEKFENWTVDSIAEQEIALRQNAGLLRVGLDYDGSTPPAGPIAAPPPSAKTETRDDAPAAKALASDPFSAIRDAKRSGH